VTLVTRGRKCEILLTGICLRAFNTHQPPQAQSLTVTRKGFVHHRYCIALGPALCDDQRDVVMLRARAEPPNIADDLLEQSLGGEVPMPPQRLQ